jgi:hypothetical protein
VNPVNPHSNSNDEVVSPSQEAEALVAEIAPNVNEDGVAHAGGTNSSAPISGVDDERTSPLQTVIRQADHIPFGHTDSCPLCTVLDDAGTMMAPSAVQSNRI